MDNFIVIKTRTVATEKLRAAKQIFCVRDNVWRRVYTLPTFASVSICAKTALASLKPKLAVTTTAVPNPD